MVGPRASRADAHVEPGIDREPCIPDPAGLTADGMLEPGDLDAVGARLRARGADDCAGELVRLVEEYSFYSVTNFALEIFAAWDSPASLPHLYAAFGRAMLRPMGRDEELAFTSASAIATTVPNGDVTGPMREAEIADGWLRLGRARYLTEWASTIEDRGISPPEFDEQFRETARQRYFSCLADPKVAPVDPFDPLGLAQGPTAKLSLGTRCASSAVLSVWSQGGGDWPETVRELLARYVQTSPFLDLAQQLEVSWGQGTRNGGSPGRGHWRSPDSSGSRLFVWGVLVFLLAAAGWALYRSSPATRSRILAIVVGFSVVLGAEMVLTVAGTAPGSEYRWAGPSPLRGASEAGATQLRDLNRRPFAVPPPEGVARVAIVGASSVAGPGLSIEQKIGQRLRGDLLAEVPCLEVVNLGQHGFASPGVRGLALQAVDDFGAHLVMVYTGHNEVADMRERQRFTSESALRTEVLAPLERARLYGLLRSFGEPRDRSVVSKQERVDGEEALEEFNEDFERLVTVRFRREVEDMVLSLKWRDVPLVLTVPAFNHHGLRVKAMSTGSGDGMGLESVVEALRSGHGDEALQRAVALAEEEPQQAASWLLESLAAELAGDLRKAEAATWETLRRNHAGSAVTPGIASSIEEIARSHGQPLDDAHAATHEESWPHQPGFDLFTDYVHVNPAGAAVIAAEAAQTLRGSGLVEMLAARCGP
jgi:hypothetical protein